jgi:septum site-determining protein MinC
MSIDTEQVEVLHESHTTVEVTSFILKGSLYPLTSLQLLSTRLDALDQHLKLKIQQAPRFFENTPIVLDLSRLPQHLPTPDFQALCACLRQHALIPVGIRKTNVPTLNAAALAAGLAVLAENKSETTVTPEPTTPPYKLITQPVRSGQQIYAQGGDLIILSSVSPGAEILADGNIHVYGPLRGRALAGVMNNTQAHIFCQQFEAELISIAGQYQINENLRTLCWNQPVHVHLANNQLHIDKL